MATVTLEEISALYEKYVMETYARADLLFVRGKGCRLYDSAGREYLDFAAGIAVCSLGHCHPAVTKAIQEQAAKLVHVSNLFLNEWQPRLAQKLISHGFDGTCFFCNSGAEANEALIKLARKNGAEKGRYEIIVMNDSFHGRTLATLAATGRSKYRKGFAPDMPGFKFVNFNDADAVRNAISEKTAAVMFFAWQSFGIEPDALSMAKALGNGYPIGAMVAKRKYSHVLTPGTHASTFGGTALASAAACAVIDAIDNEKILDNVARQSGTLMDGLSALSKKYPCIRGVRGRGLMVGAVLDRPAGAVLGILRSKGMIALSAGENVLRLVPPLNVSDADCALALELIDGAFAELCAK